MAKSQEPRKKKDPKRMSWLNKLINFFVRTPVDERPNWKYIGRMKRLKKGFYSRQEILARG